MRTEHISLSQFAEELGLDPRAIRYVLFSPTQSSVRVIVEDEMQTTGTCPPLSDNTKRKPKKGKK